MQFLRCCKPIERTRWYCTPEIEPRLQVVTKQRRNPDKRNYDNRRELRTLASGENRRPTTGQFGSQEEVGYLNIAAARVRAGKSGEDGQDVVEVTKPVSGANRCDIGVELFSGLFVGHLVSFAFHRVLGAMERKTLLTQQHADAVVAESNAGHVE
jgi:hypothetical protein